MMLKNITFDFMPVFIICLFMISCSNISENKDQEHVQSQTIEKKDHDQAIHSHKDNNHMSHMNEVRDALKKELGDKYDAPVPDVSKEQLALGAEVYKQNCASCHGEQGKGDGPASVGLPSPPANFTDAAHATYYSEEGRRQIIRKGVTGTVMVPWENVLNKNEIDAVYGYIKSLISKENIKKESHEENNHKH